MSDFKEFVPLIQRLRACLPQYLREKQVGSLKKNFRCLNPAHEDKNASMHFYEQSMSVYCFRCAQSYDLFNLIAWDYPDCDTFPRQVKKACDLFGETFPADFGMGERGSLPAGGGNKIAAVPAPVRRRAPAAEAAAPAADFTGTIEEYIQQVGVGGSYFSRRGITQEMCEKYHLFQKEGRAWLPVYDGDRCVSYCARAIAQDLQPRYKNSKGPMGIFGGDYLRGEGRGGWLFITEAIFDALSLEQMGFQAMALCGVANVGKFIQRCKENPAAAGSYEMIAAGDNDESGRRMNAQLKEQLQELGIPCGELILPLGAKDCNELFLQDPEALRQAALSAGDEKLREYEKTNAANAISELMDASLRRASREAVSTGFPRLDELLDGGLYAGLYIIGAISSLGKTSYILQIADYIARQETDVLYFSLEMGKLELMAKSVSRISYQQDPSAERHFAFTARQVLKAEQGRSQEKTALLKRALEEYEQVGKGLYLREGISDIGVGEIREAVAQHIRLRKVRPVVVVDYLQILKPADLKSTDKQNTDRSVVELKRISRDFDIPVIAISSFNRENYKSAVTMEAFKESGAVEYSSDVLLGLQLYGTGENGFDVNAAKNKTPRSVELVLLKNRNGIPYAKIEYAYHPKFSFFKEM